MTVHGFVHGFACPPIFSCRATYVTTSPDRLWDRALVPVTSDGPDRSSQGTRPNHETHAKFRYPRLVDSL